MICLLPKHREYLCGYIRPSQNTLSDHRVRSDKTFRNYLSLPFQWVKHHNPSVRAILWNHGFLESSTVCPFPNKNIFFVRSVLSMVYRTLLELLNLRLIPRESHSLYFLWNHKANAASPDTVKRSTETPCFPWAIGRECILLVLILLRKHPLWLKCLAVFLNCLMVISQ